MNLATLVRHQWDRVSAVVCLLGGLVSILTGYLAASDTRKTEEQIPELASNGLFGLVLVAVAVTLWLSADLRDEWIKLDELHTLLSETAPIAADAETAPAPAPSPADHVDGLGPAGRHTLVQADG